MATVGCADWPVDFSDCDASDTWEELSDADRERFETMAVENLWNWTGRAFGLCSVSISPCRRTPSMMGGSTFWGRGPYASPGSWAPVLLAGRWVTPTCGSCGSVCGCGPTVFPLPGPVEAVTEVRVGGVVLADWELRGNDLVRTDGQPWPSIDGSWEVDYVRGIPVPVGGRLAAGILTVELAKAACQDKTCALPKRVQSITRQGVSIAVLDSFDDIEKGHTGIWLIDSWVASVTKAPGRSGVASPDTRRGTGVRVAP